MLTRIGTPTRATLDQDSRLATAMANGEKIARAAVTTVMRSSVFSMDQPLASMTF
ncbi:hypothetical protein D3C73_1580540 [compost metagenome]